MLRSLLQKKKTCSFWLVGWGSCVASLMGPALFFFSSRRKKAGMKNLSLYTISFFLSLCAIFLCVRILYAFTSFLWIKHVGVSKEKTTTNIKIFFSDCAMGNRCGNQTESGGYTFPYRSKQLITDNFNQKCFGVQTLNNCRIVLTMS